MNPCKLMTILWSTVVLLVLIGCNKTQESATQQTTAVSLTCAKESFPSLPDVKITAASQESAPAPHCKVVGVIGPEIGFELLLPDNWNSKFVMGGSGGFSGSFVNGAQDIFGAIQKGYATVATDTGHKGHAMDASWALNHYERLENFGHQAVHRTAVNSKALTKAYSNGI